MQKELIKQSALDTVMENNAGKETDWSCKNISVFCDFDGTISIGDVTDVLLERLANPEWQIVEERWQAGELDDYECMAEQIALINGSWQDITDLLEKVELDKNFKSFVNLCNQAKIPVYIGSSGLDKVINYFLTREGVKVNDIWAYQLIESGQGWSLKFPQEEPRINCRYPKSLACKCSLLQSKQLTNKDDDNAYSIVIGDGRSDFCWVSKADFVFAKAKLVDYCRQNNITHAMFADFSDINQCMLQKTR